MNSGLVYKSALQIERTGLLFRRDAVEELKEKILDFLDLLGFVEF